MSRAYLIRNLKSADRMAILLVKVEEQASLPMNEFFDYDGICWGLSRSRSASGRECIRLEDFYDSDVSAQELSQVTVVFVCKEDRAEKDEDGWITVGEGDEDSSWQAAGWYRKARIFRDLQLPSLFLEGNIRADARDVTLLPAQDRFPVDCSFKTQSGGFLGKHEEETFYEVVETMDSRYDDLRRRIDSYQGQGEFLSFARAQARPQAGLLRSYETCIDRCSQIAQALMSDECQDICEIKEMQICAEKAASLRRNEADGHYYLAMASYHLGQVRKAAKAVGRALALEPDASDIMALKASILVSMGHIPEAAELFHAAWLEEGDEDYLIMEGRSYMNGGQMDKAHACFKQVSDEELLAANGINLKDMEKKWPFMNMRGISLGRFGGKKKK